jgi:hypothetical protein
MLIHVSAFEVIQIPLCIYTIWQSYPTLLFTASPYFINTSQLIFCCHSLYKPYFMYKYWVYMKLSYVKWHAYLNCIIHFVLKFHFIFLNEIHSPVRRNAEIQFIHLIVKQQTKNAKSFILALKLHLSYLLFVLYFNLDMNYENKFI